VVLVAEDVREHDHLPCSPIIPIAIPATARRSGTPASISARLPPQTVAIDDETVGTR